MEKITFVINPIAGHKKYKLAEKKIYKYLNHKKFDLSIKYSKKKGDVKTISQKAIANGANIIIAVGGDGTVNELSSVLINSKIKMGVIPIGSGNGLALCLGIPTNIRQAIEIINLNQIKKIDCIAINNLHSINIIGFGFDAFVAKKFAKESKRGLLKYIFLTLSLLRKYNPKTYTIKINNTIKNISAFSLNICNGQQFGNNFLISPKAKLDDGEFNVCIIKPFKWYEFLILITQFYFKKIHFSKFYQSYKATELTIESKTKNLIHLDGESHTINNKVNINVIPKSINFIA